jgi:Questin oxidase-like
MTRRTALAAAAALTLRAAPADQALDEALSRIHRQEPDCTQGLSTHAPMVAEALSSLGQAERAPQWVESYRGPVLRLPGRTAPIEKNRWRESLGPRPGTSNWEEANPRWADWLEFFTAELAEAQWKNVLDMWVGRLAPGLSGAATHGAIRTAHAARGMARRASPARRAELARGLAYWASSYEELPGGAQAPRIMPAFADALADVPLYWDAFERAPEGRNIVEQLRHVAELQKFGQVRGMIPQPKDLSAALSALTAAFARVYLRHGSRHHAIAFVHAVTGPASLRRLLPHIRRETALAAFPYAWQAAAAIYSAYARPSDPKTREESKLDRGELVAAAIRAGGDHAIKFTEVMLTEHGIQPDPVYLAAAEDAIARL